MKQLALAIVALTGCVQSYDVDAYWDELGTTHCQRMRDCCSAVDYDDWWDGNDNACAAAWGAPETAKQIKAGMARGTIHFDARAAHTCVDTLRDQACGDFEQAYRYRESYCTPPLQGELEAGAGCEVDEECTSRACELGRCVATVAPGAVCQPTDTCAGPYECGGTCTLGNPEGISCTTDSECVDSWCKTDLFDHGTCKRACKGEN